MNTMFSANQASSHAPKRSNSGREIVYIQNQRIIGTAQPAHDSFLTPPTSNQLASPSIPADVVEVFNTVLRKYTYRDIHRWLKIDRQEEISRLPAQLRQSSSDSLPALPGHGARHSVASSARTSRTSSVFSVPQYDRHSFASSHTSYSVMSEPSTTPEQQTMPSPQQLQMAQGGLPLNSKKSAGQASPSSQSKASRISSVSTHQRPSARQRESELEVKKRYYCTACNKGFARKYDWKVHEQRYHEQQAQYPCPDCNQILYAETHFRSHHRDAHDCQQCTHAKEVSRDVDPRRRRTAWGCGFCSALLDDWEKRCDHISQHYDEGLKRTDWDHSKVVIGLLRQPDIDNAWQSLLIEKHGQCPNPPLFLRWSKETTARSHGDDLQLQDWLELGATTRDVNSIVQLAYEHGYRPPSDTSMSLPTVSEDSVSPPTETPQDSVMASPMMESTSQPAPTSYPFVENALSSPMSYPTSQPSQVSDGRRATVQPGNLENWNSLSDTLFQATNFMHHHQSMPPFVDKALPPTPVDADVNMMQAPGSSDANSGHFETWSLMTGSTFTDDSGAIVVGSYDPNNLF